MGWLGNALGIAGGFGRGATSASLWTGNMIYTALQKSRTKKEIKTLYKHAADANFRNRGVATLPGISKQQLLLISNEPDDNDVYDLKTKSGTAALDYIWQDNDTNRSVIVSGGLNEPRVCALIPFLHKAQSACIPVVVLHSGNKELENMVRHHSRVCEFVSGKSCYYDIFRGMPTDDIAYLLYETMPTESASPCAESLMRALIEILLLTEGNITLHSLASFPLPTLKTKLDGMFNTGALSQDEYDDINHYYMSGSSESDSVRIFLNKLNRQAESICGKPRPNLSNMKKILNQKGVFSVDIGTSGNDLLLALVLQHLQLLQSQGKDFAIILDGIPLAKHEKIGPTIRGRLYAISNQDFVSSLFGGSQRGEDLFSELTGNVDTAVIFRHASGASCRKWSEHFGQYRKIRIKYNIAQNNAFMNTSNTKGISVDETDEPRIRAETIGKLPDGVACIHNMDGVLIAQVNEG